MPVQTIKGDNIYFPDGAAVKIKRNAIESYFDLGAINSAVTATMNYDVNEVETANFGKLARQIRNLTVAGSFTLINLSQDGLDRMGGGVFTLVNTPGTPVSTIPDQEIAAGWSGNVKYPLVIKTSSSDSTKLRTTVKPTITSITLDPTGTPEVLAEDSEYIIVADSGSSSGWSVIFIPGNMTTVSPTTYEIEIVYGTNTPIQKSTLYAGSSTVLMNAYSMLIEHTDSNGLVRSLELFSVDTDSGGFQFGFKGANEDGVEEMPLAFTAKIDTSLTDGRQLLAWSIDNGAA